MVYKILLLENVDKSVLKLFDNDNFEVEYVKSALSEEELIDKIGDVHIIGVRSKTELNKCVLQKAKELLVVGCFCIGTNQVDLDYCKKMNIAVFNSPFMNTRSVSELIICLIISLARKIGQQNISMHRGAWEKSSEGCYEIRNKILGIIGYGHVGSQVSVLAENMGMRVIYYDVLPVMAIGNSRKCDTMEELLQEADFVTLHVPLSEETNNLIDEKEIKLMKPRSYLLNLSRGNVVNVEAVKKFIIEEHLAGYAADVYPSEPKKKISQWDSCLRGLENVILTPHIGGSTIEAQYNIGQDTSNKIINYICKGATNECLTLPQILVNGLNGNYRILNIHRNIPGAIMKINSLLNEYNINIKKQYLATKDEIGYCIVDFEKDIEINDLLIKLNDLDINIKTRIVS